MTVPIASLFATPPDAGTRSAASGGLPAPDSDNVFAALVSALFEAAEGPQTADPATQQPQSQTVAAAEANAPAGFVNPNLTIGDATGNPPPQISTPSTPEPGPASQTAHVIELAQAAFENVESPEHAPAADDGSPNLQGSADAPRYRANNSPQNEKAAASSASDVQVLPDIAALTSQVEDAGSPAATGSSAIAIGLPGQGAETPAQSVTPTGSSANSSSTAPQEKPDHPDEQGQQPLIDLLSLSEIASAVIAQLLAAQPQPNAQQGQAKFDQSVASTQTDEAPAPADTENNLDAADIGAVSLPPATSGVVTQPSGTVPASVQASASNTNAADAAAELISAANDPARSGAPVPAPNAGSQNEAARSAGKPNHSSFAAVTAPQPYAGQESADAAKHAQPAAPLPAATTTSGAPDTTLPSTPDAGDGSSDSAGQLSLATARPEVKTKDDSGPAIQPTVSKPSVVALPAAEPETTSADNSGDTPVVSNSAVDAALSNVVVRPGAAVTHDVAGSSTPSAEAVSVDSSTRPSVLPRGARGSRGGLDNNRGAVDAQSPSLTASAPDSASAPDKSEPIASSISAQDRDTPKTVLQAAPAHLPDSAPEADAPKPHQTADLSSAAEPPLAPVDRTEAPAISTAPQPLPASIDIVPPVTGSTHGFEIPLAQTAAPHAQDAPVKLVFNGPNAPDNSAFDALALKIASHSSDGDSHFSIRLDPPELGKIEVNLSVDAHGHAQAELSADKAQTLELLQKDASSLERALKDAGLNLSGGLAFSLKGDGRSQAWRDSQNGRSRAVQIAAADAASASATMTARAALAAHAYGLPMSNLDIRV